MRLPLLLPALVFQVASAAIPGVTEVARGVFVLVGLPSAETISAMKSAGVTYVICLCRETEPGVNIAAESRQMADAGIGFARLVVEKNPTAADFELFGQLRAALPAGARILVHCRDGNRAAGVAVGWLARQGLIKRGEAIALARKAGMVRPETEKALANYLGLTS